MIVVCPPSSDLRVRCGVGGDSCGRRCIAVLLAGGGASGLSRKHPAVCCLMMDWRTRRAARDVTASVPPCVQFGRELGRPERFCSRHDHTTFAIGSAHDPSLKVTRAHADRGENHQAVGHARVAVQDDAAALDWASSGAVPVRRSGRVGCTRPTSGRRHPRSFRA